MLAGFIICFVLVAAFLAWIIFGFEEKPKKVDKTNGHFERLNDVEGILWADDEALNTYNIGCLNLNEQVDVRFYSNADSVLITDIVFNGQSTFSFDVSGKTYREKADFAIQTLKHNANTGLLPMNLVCEVEEIVLQVDDLNKYLEEGKVRILPNDDFAWA